jgi:hypothetical protein
MQFAQTLQESPNYAVERTAGSHRVAAVAHRSVEFMHNDDKHHPTRWPAGELRKVNSSSIMRLSVSTVRQCQPGDLGRRFDQGGAADARSRLGEDDS